MAARKLSKVKWQTTENSVSKQYQDTLQPHTYTHKPACIHTIQKVSLPYTVQIYLTCSTENIKNKQMLHLKILHACPLCCYIVIIIIHRLYGSIKEEKSPTILHFISFPSGETAQGRKTSALLTVICLLGFGESVVLYILHNYGDTLVVMINNTDSLVI